MVGCYNALMGAAVGSDSGASLPGGGIFVDDYRIIPTNSSATFNFDSTGTYSSVANTSAPSGTWKNSGAGADYDVRYDTSSGTATGSAVNTWLNAGTSRAWSVADSLANGAAVQSSGTLRIRRAATGIELASCSLTIRAEKDS